MILELLQFFFQSFSHWLGGLIYLVVGTACFGVAIGVTVELIRGK